MYPEKFTIEIIDGIRKITPENFVIGIRLGGFEPTLDDGISHAKLLEQNGIDFLNISYGFQMEHQPYTPDGFPYQDIIYAAKKIKQAVSVPVFAVGGITSPEMAASVLEETKVDMVDIGRGFLVNPNWANDAENGKDTGKCLHCKVCKRFGNTEKCAGKILFSRQHETR
jgi:2,4-dienoyl-CoA reductase-like NADH-dependent reductase (Old Yellow Enzyme family)